MFGPNRALLGRFALCTSTLLVVVCSVDSQETGFMDEFHRRTQHTPPGLEPAPSNKVFSEHFFKSMRLNKHTTTVALALCYDKNHFTCKTTEKIFQGSPVGEHWFGFGAETWILDP